MVVATLAVVQGVEDFPDRGEPSFNNHIFILLNWNTATEETGLPLKKLPTYSDTQIHRRLFVADEAAIMAVSALPMAILFRV